MKTAHCLKLFDQDYSTNNAIDTKLYETAPNNLESINVNSCADSSNDVINHEYKILSNLSQHKELIDQRMEYHCTVCGKQQSGIWPVYGL